MKFCFEFKNDSKYIWACLVAIGTVFASDSTCKNSLELKNSPRASAAVAFKLYESYVFFLKNMSRIEKIAVNHGTLLGESISS